MSFASIPAGSGASVQLRVTLLSGQPTAVPVPFLRSDEVSIRPRIKGIEAGLMSDGTVQISTSTEENFAGKQFILWWSRSSTQGGGIQGLAFFLDPIYQPPTGSNVKVIAAPTDLTANLSSYDTLDFEGIVPIAPASLSVDGGIARAGVFEVPVNIYNIYLGQNAWVQGKFLFQSTASAGNHRRTVSGPGVLDVSRFQYNLRACTSAMYAGEGYNALSVPAGFSLDNFDLEGIVISDTNHAADDPLFNSTVNNVKTISWNGVNAGLKLEDNTTASNVFVRSGDDSLMVWGSNITVTGATVWQNYNGGVVNLGWFNNSTGDNCLIDGL
jgi:hypothetical protein